MNIQNFFLNWTKYLLAIFLIILLISCGRSVKTKLTANTKSQESPLGESSPLSSVEPSPTPTSTQIPSGGLSSGLMPEPPIRLASAIKSISARCPNDRVFVTVDIVVQSNIPQKLEIIGAIEADLTADGACNMSFASLGIPPSGLVGILTVAQATGVHQDPLDPRKIVVEPGGHLKLYAGGGPSGGRASFNFQIEAQDALPPPPAGAVIIIGPPVQISIESQLCNDSYAQSSSTAVECVTSTVPISGV